MLFFFFSTLKNILDDSISRPLIFLSQGQRFSFFNFYFFLVEEFLILKTFNF